MKIRSPLLTKLLARVAGWVLLLLFRTWRIDYRCESQEADPSVPGDRSYLFALWHDAILVPISICRRCRAPRIHALVSRHQDGSYLDEFMKQAGISSVRGSTNHGGVQALRELMRRAGGNHIFITPDGPRGPRRQLKEGIVFLASHTGIPIVPSASVSLNAWHIRGSWTDLAIPKPFSRSICLLGEPIAIPPDLSRAELTMWRDRVQAAMERQEEKAQRILRGEELPAAQRKAA